jgi:hypothetical protein
MGCFIGRRSLKTKYNLMHGLLPPELLYPYLLLIIILLTFYNTSGQDDGVQEAGSDSVG